MDFRQPNVHPDHLVFPYMYRFQPFNSWIEENYFHRNEYSYFESDTRSLHEFLISHDRLMFIRRVLRHGDSHDRNVLFHEVCERFWLTASHFYGNFVVQHFLQRGNMLQKEMLHSLIQPHFFYLAVNKFGKFVALRALKKYSGHYLVKLAESLRTHVIQCMTDHHGSFVMEAVLKYVLVSDLGFILDEIEGHVVELCKHKNASFVMRSIFATFSSNNLQSLVWELCENIHALCSDGCGHNVIEEIFANGYKRPQVKRDVFEALLQNFVAIVFESVYTFMLIKRLIYNANFEERRLMLFKIIDLENGVFLYFERHIFGRVLLQVLEGYVSSECPTAHAMLQQKKRQTRILHDMIQEQRRH